MKTLNLFVAVAFAALLSLIGTGASQALPNQEIRTYYVTDAVGSPVIATDANANVTWSEDYLPYGERRYQQARAGGNDRWFTGAAQNYDSGLVSLGNRYYDPILGRFLSIDPVGASGERPFSVNRYAYANNNPYRYTDPDGRESACVTLGGCDVDPRRISENFRMLTDFVTDFTPVVGDAKSVSAAIDDPTPVNLIAAGVGLVPGIGDVAGKGLKVATKELRAVREATTLKPGAFAKESIPGHMGKPTAVEQKQINEIMERNGCHTCGTANPGTKSGNAVVDHQPPQALGNTTDFFPHCIDCMRRQGGEVLQELIKRGKDQ